MYNVDAEPDGKPRLREGNSHQIGGHRLCCMKSGMK